MRSAIRSANPVKVTPQLALTIFGTIFLGSYHLALVWPSGSVWHSGPHQSNDYLMIVGVYATLGALLPKAAQSPKPVSV